MDALKLLKHDHDEMKKMLHQLEEMDHARSREREQLFRRIEREFSIHEDIEEKIIYPAFKREAELKDIVLEGYQEHHVADLLLGEMRNGLSMTEDVWNAKLTVLREQIEHHIEEEEGEMFKTARRIFQKEELEELGRKIAARKREDEDLLAA